MDKPWLKSYQAGVPAEIDVNVHPSVVDIFTSACKDYAELPSFTNFGKTINYRELDNYTNQFASWLIHEAGLKKGDRIAIMMPNLLQYPVAVFGALRAGLVVVNTNPLYTDRELEHQLKDSGARAIVVVEAFASTLADVVGSTDVEFVITTRFGDMLSFPKSMLLNFVIRHVKKMVKPYDLPGSFAFKDVLSKGASLPAVSAELNHDDIAFLRNYYHRLAALPHLRTYRELSNLYEARCIKRTHYQSTRHARLCQRVEEISVYLVYRCEHPFQRVNEYRWL